jgi:hypothetical protein
MMATEKRLIDASRFAEDLLMSIVKARKKYFGDPVMCEVIGLLEIVRNQLSEYPTVDAVEVVRCADCKCWCEDTLSCTMGNHYDDNWYAEDFCSYGERK